MFCKLSNLLRPALLTVATLPAAIFATEALHINTANINKPADAIIDATAVQNRGTFDFSQNTTAVPWDTSNTRFFTNGPAGPALPGVMKGSVGFRFDFAPSFGSRQPSAVFNNVGSGSISTLQGNGPDYLLVNATNIYNQGLMSVSAKGILRYDGTNIDLSKGGLEVRAIEGQGTSTSLQQGTFTPDIAIYDNYWGLNLLSNDLSQTPFINVAGASVGVASPPHNVSSSPPAVTLSLQNPDSAYYDATNGPLLNIVVTNAALVPVVVRIPTNITRQAIFVGGEDPAALDPNFTVSFKLADSPDPFNFMKTLMFQIANSATNVINPTQPIQTSIYIKDTLTSVPSPLFLAFNSSPAPAPAGFRPSNYEISRTQPNEWQNGQDPALNLTNGLFFFDQAHDSNSVVGGIFSAYSFLANNVASGPVAATPGFTNLPGRVEVRGDTVNLSQVRVRAEGAVVFDVPNVLSTSNAAVDCESVSFVLGARSGSLKVQDLVKPRRNRVNGTVSLFSYSYTNTLFIVSTNYNTNQPPKNFDLITNACQKSYHVLIADRSKLFSTKTMVTHDLVLNSTNVNFADIAFIEDSLAINGDSFTLSGLLTLTNSQPAGSLNDFGAINAPALRHFTNFGTLLVTNVAAFGTDTLLPYDSFYNRGTIGAYSIQVASGSFDTASNLNAAGSIGISAASAVFNKGTNAALGDFQILAGSLNLNQAQIYVGGALGLNVTNALFDNGSASTNLVKITNGLAMPFKPALGDLPGTTLDTVAQRNNNAYHVWAGEDRGPSRDGFVNNVAIGKLALHADPINGVLVFQPAGVKNAMYVETLDLTGLASYTNHIEIDPGMTIYFANSVGVPPATLNGQFNGRLIWVTSKTVSSQPSLGTGMPPGLSLTWNAAGNSIYTIQTTTNLVAPSWQTLMTYTNTNGLGGSVTLLVDPAAPAANAQRYYRVNYGP